MDEEEPASASKKARVFIPVGKKVEIAEAALKVKEDAEASFTRFAKENSVQRSQINRWIKALPELKAKLMEKKDTVTMHKGMPSCLSGIEDSLYAWFVEQRDIGMALSVNLLIIKAQQLDRDFRNKSDDAKYSTLRRFLKKKNIALRASTNEAQRAPKELQDEAASFVAEVAPTLVGLHRHKDWILNMDQTPVYFSMTPKKTLNIRGARTVNVRCSSSSTMRVTVAVSITAAGTVLPLYFVFKGKPGGRIVREFKDYRTDAFYAVQDRAWMDEPRMLEWVNLVVKPWAESAPDGIVPLLLLDSYRCHLMSSIVRTIQDLGVEVIHIPGGCTGLAQPLDVGFNKPFKNHVRRLWEKYMIDEGLDMGVSKPPARSTIAEWCIVSVKAIPSSIVQNAWLHHGYSYFPTETRSDVTTVPDVRDELLVEIQATDENPINSLEL